MFDHLDDPEPYVPGPGLEQAVVRRGRSLKRRRRLLGGGVAAVVLLIAGAAGAAALLDRELDGLERVDVAGLGEDNDGNGVQVVLLAGVDSDAGLGEADPARTSRALTDTVTLVAVDTDQNLLHVLALPRDLLVDIPGHGEHRLNQAFALGGPQLLLDTVRTDLGIEVDHYLQTDFAGAIAMGDALGGLRLDFADPTRDRFTGLDAPAGCRTYDGSELLGIGRSRRVEVHDGNGWVRADDGDLGRIRRQQAIGAALLQRLTQLDAGDPAELVRLTRTAVDHLVVDQGTPASELLELFRGIAGAQLEAATIPVDPATRDGAAVLERRPDEAQATVRWLLDPEPRSPQDRGPGNPVYSGAGWGVPVPCGEDG